MRALAPNLRRALTDSGDSQRFLASFCADWLARNDVLAELDKMAARRNRPAGERDALAAVSAVIRDALRREAEVAAAKDEPVDTSGPSPAAVSKWLQDVYAPTARYWLPLAVYMRIPVWELYELLHTEVEDETEAPYPQSVVGLMARLEEATARTAAAEAEAAALDAEVQRLVAANARAERSLVDQERRIAQLEAAAADARVVVAV